MYVRRARSSVEPGSELAELYDMFGYIVTEERTVAGVSVDELDLTSFENYLKRLGLDLDVEPQIAVEDDLRSRGVLADLGGSACATVYGLLAFGKSPQSYPQTQNFFVQCVSYAGEDRAADVIEVGNPRARNQSITNFLLTMGLMEQRGRGSPIIAAALREHGLAPPVLEEDREARWVRAKMSTLIQP